MRLGASTTDRLACKLDALSLEASHSNSFLRTSMERRVTLLPIVVDMPMAAEPDFALQKSEIAFFMEKTFQISFTYFGGLVAFFALSKTAVTSAVVKATGIPLGILAALVILLLNLLYVTLACACI